MPADNKTKSARIYVDESDCSTDVGSLSPTSSSSTSCDESPSSAGSDGSPPNFATIRAEVHYQEPITDYYDILERIGEGKYGTVYRCRSKRTALDRHPRSGDRAVKRIIAARSLDGRRGLEREVEIMRHLSGHPKIIKLYDAFINAKDSRESFFVMELVEGGELFERVAEADSRVANREKDAAQIIRQLCDAIHFVHRNGIVHMDVKPENILCLSKTANQIKLIDFGLAHYYDPKTSTPEYVAPEVISYNEIDFKTDMWSIGVIAYVLVSGLSPFLGDTDAETYGNVTKGQWDCEEEEFDSVSDDAKDFLNKLIVTRKSGRMSAAESLNHPWLNLVGEDGGQLLMQKQRMRRYVVRRRWRKAFNAIVAVTRMGWQLQSGAPDCTKDTTTDSSRLRSKAAPPLLVSPSTLPPLRRYVPRTRPFLKHIHLTSVTSYSLLIRDY